jgi:hypothetical protein
MSNLPDDLQGECLDCDGEAGDPTKNFCTYVELWDNGTLELFLEKFDLSIGEVRFVKRKTHVNELDFRWKSDRELHESLGPVFQEMIAAFDAEVEAALA